MRRYTLSFMLSFAMAFSLVNVDLSNMIENPAEMVSIGPDVAEARSRGGSSRSFSRPSRPAPRAPRPAPPRAAPAKPKPATPPRAAPAKPKPGTAVAKPAPKKTDSATRAAARTQSRTKAATAKPTIRSSSGKPIKVAGTPASKSVRGLSSSQYSSRGARRDSAFNSREGMRTPAQRTTVINNYGGGFYGDPYGGLFMYSLLSMSLHHQSTFHYHHWNSYSAQRQQALLAENAALKAEMAAMSGPRNANYAPEGTDPDLMYSNEFVNAAYNPAPVPVEKSGFPIWWTLFGISVLGFGTWFIFFRRTPEPVDFS